MGHAALAIVALAAMVHADRPLQVVFSAECNHLFDWHTAAIFYSFELSGFSNVANLTRLLACNEEERKTYSPANLAIGPTFVHRNLRDDPLVDEKGYPSYNKPYSVMAWLETRPAIPEGEDEFVLMTDADMVFTAPLDPRTYGAARGVVVSAEYSYLVGTQTGFAKRFIDEEIVHKLAQVGGFHIFHTEDLRRIAPLWLEYTKRVRAFSFAEPELFFAESMRPLEPYEENLKAVRQKQSRWHSEMYGYVFAAGVVGVTHHTRRDVMLYPGYQPWLGRAPMILHYGADYHLNYQDGLTGEVYFNKMNQVDLQIEKCPEFLFGAFPVNHWGNVSKRDALAIEHLAMLDGGLCRYYRQHNCPSSPKLAFCEDSDNTVRGILSGVQSVFDFCHDELSACPKWASAGECKANPLFMFSNCPKACETCNTPTHELVLEADMHLGDWKWQDEQNKAKESKTEPEAKTDPETNIDEGTKVDREAKASALEGKAAAVGTPGDQKKTGDEGGLASGDAALEKHKAAEALGADDVLKDPSSEGSVDKDHEKVNVGAGAQAASEALLDAKGVAPSDEGAAAHALGDEAQQEHGKAGGSLAGNVGAGFQETSQGGGPKDAPPSEKYVPPRALNPRLVEAKRLQAEREAFEEQHRLRQQGLKDAHEQHNLDRRRDTDGEDHAPSSSMSAQRAAAKAAWAATKAKREALSAHTAHLSPMMMVGLAGVAVAILLLLRRLGFLGKRKTKKMYEDKCAV